jgi:hypothetical protein
MLSACGGTAARGTDTAADGRADTGTPSSLDVTGSYTPEMGAAALFDTIELNADGTYGAEHACRATGAFNCESISFERGTYTVTTRQFAGIAVDVIKFSPEIGGPTGVGFLAQRVFSVSLVDGKLSMDTRVNPFTLPQSETYVFDRNPDETPVDVTGSYSPDNDASAKLFDTLDLNADGTYAAEHFCRTTGALNCESISLERGTYTVETRQLGGLSVDILTFSPEFGIPGGTGFLAQRAFSVGVANGQLTLDTRLNPLTLPASETFVFDLANTAN